MARTLTEAEVIAWMRHAGFSEEQISAEMAAHRQRRARPRIAAMMAKPYDWARILWSLRRRRNRRAVNAMYQWAKSHPGLAGQAEDQGAGG
jgi:hypothetical protein